MGDALSTYFEARACACSGGRAGGAALGLARLCYDTLMADGLKAKRALERQQCTDAVERIVEAITLLSGIGFESGGLAAAHAVHNGFTMLNDCRKMYHGEIVAFCTLVQLAMENDGSGELAEIADWCVSLGLPATLGALGITQDVEKKVLQIARASCTAGSSINNMPFSVTPELVYQAILDAAAAGKEAIRAPAESSME